MNRDATAENKRPSDNAAHPPIVIQHDLTCWGCGYNLRSLLTDADCPECGTPVMQSLSGDRLLFSPLAWLRRLSHAATWLFVGTIIYLLVYGAGRFLSPRAYDWMILLRPVIHLITAVFLVGVFLVTRREPGRATARMNVCRHLARWLMVISFIWWMITMFIPYMGFWIYMLGFAIRGAVYTAGIIMFYVYLADIIKRMDPSSLSRQARLISLAYALAYVLSLCSVGAMVLNYNDIITRDHVIYLTVQFLNASLYIALLVWVAVFMFMLRRRLATTCRHARGLTPSIRLAREAWLSDAGPRTVYRGGSPINPVYRD